MAPGRQPVEPQNFVLLDGLRGLGATLVLIGHILLVLGPVVVLSTLALFASGVSLIVLGPAGGVVLGLHKASFAVWVAAMSAHVLAHFLRVPRLAAADWRSGEPLPGSSLRRWLLAGSLVAGLVLAVATVHLAGPWHQFVGLDG